MIDKMMQYTKLGALTASIVWLAACSAATAPSTTTTTQQPTTATTTAAATESAPAASSPSESATAEIETTAATAIDKLNLNSATAEEFLTIPDVGDRMVHEFEEYRPYISIQQFRREIGKYVDEAQVAAYEEYLYVPVVPNSSDAETLQQLPGVTADIAEELMAARPYASNAAFLEALAGLVTPEQLASGESYLESE